MTGNGNSYAWYLCTKFLVASLHKFPLNCLPSFIHSKTKTMKFSLDRSKGLHTYQCLARDYIHINVLFSFFITICPQTNACDFTKPLGAHNASFPANLVSSVIFLLFSIFLNKKLGRGKQLRYEEFTKARLTHLLKLKRGKSRVLMSLPPSAVSVSSLGRNVVSNWKPLPSYNSKSSSSFNVWDVQTVIILKMIW